MHDSFSKYRSLFRASTIGLVVAIAFMAEAQAQTPAEVYLYIDADGDGVPEETILSPATPALSGKTPVLFVHGHDPVNPTDVERNYKKNWQMPLNGLTSFKAALNHPDNAWLDIEPYYIRFQNQDRSIVEDAREIEWAVEHILKRHDGSHIPFTSNPTTDVKLAIVGYSKGTISTRCYLKSLQTPSQEPGPCHFGTPRDGFNPVSEFIAIAPPSHGLAVDLVALALLSGPHVLNSLALKQLNNGYKNDCTLFLLQRAQSRDFIESLNGHDIEDSNPPASAPAGWLPATHDGEAPGSRPSGSATSTGTLYVSLYADSTDNNGVLVARDLVGGSYPSADCQGRILAKNLAANAENIEVSAIPGQSSGDVHANSVHTPEVICLALYTVSRHDVPGNPAVSSCTMDGQVPLIPRPRPWWWIFVIGIVLVALIPLGLRVVRRGT